MKNKNNCFSLMIVPPSGKNTIMLRLSKWGVTVLISILLLFISLSATAFYFAFKTSTKLVKYHQVKKELTSKNQQTESFLMQINELKSDIDLIIEKEQEIENLIGDSSKGSRKYRSRKKIRKRLKSQRFEKKYKKLAKSESIDGMRLLLRSRLDELKKTVKRMHQKAQHNKVRFASTPSLWPVYGRIRSKFGWRRHPLTGKRVFHKGIDIPSWRGSPIKATADGIVKYAGWSGTFGYVVLIDHSYGYRTIYAHASQILTRRGKYVKKGQVIAQVGSTGLSTGSHLHYEIRKWDKAVNPKQYLDLDMFTASTRIW